MLQDRRLSVRMISEVVGVSVGTVDTILTEDLQLHKICAKDPHEGPETVPRGLLH